MPMPVRAPAKPALKVAGDDLSDTWRLTATVAARVDDAPVSVSFAVLRKGKAWQRLAVDDSPPYRAFIDPRRFRKNEPVHVVAIARSLDGELATSKVIALTVKKR
jgi:hypothetical protein